MKHSHTPPKIISRRPPNRSTNSQYYVVAITCCVILVAGFFLAARQHFSSIDYGIKNSRLRRQLDELQDERRRLLLAREVSLTPAEIRKAARRAGFSEATLARSESTTVAVKPQEGPGTAAARTVARPPAPQTKILPTVLSQPVIKPERPDKQARRDTPAGKKDRT